MLKEKMHEDLWAGVDLKRGYAFFGRNDAIIATA